MLDPDKRLKKYLDLEREGRGTVNKPRTYEISYITLSHQDLTQLLIKAGLLKEGVQRIFDVKGDHAHIGVRIKIGTEVPYELDEEV